MAKYSDAVEAVEQVPLESVKALQYALKSHKMEWAADLAMLMFGERSKMATTRVYNIVAGQLKNNAARVEFMLHGYKLLEKYKKKQDEALKVAEKVSSDPQ